jgi:hypothetical protein
VREFAHDDGHGHLEFEFHADSTGTPGLAKYQIGLNELHQKVTRLLEGG